jgi:two-component system, cell cycle sensor histidine kinase and response regulator CckA
VIATKWYRFPRGLVPAWRGRRQALRYGAALLATLVAVTVRLLFQPVLGDATVAFLTPLVAVVFVSWYAGLGPALVSLTLGALAAAFLVLPPTGRLAIDDPHAVTELVMYLVVGTASAVLGGLVHRTRRRSDESEERLRMALDAARMIAWEWDPVADRVSATSNLAEVYGLAPGTTIENAGQGFPLVHPDDRERHQATVTQALTSRGSYVSRFRVTRPLDQAVIWLEERAAAVLEGPGERVCLRGIAMDITERVRAEEALRQSQAHLELLSDSAPALISYIGPDLRYHACNRGYTTWFGLPRDQVVGRDMREVLGEKAWEAVGPRVRAALAGETVDYEAEVGYRYGGTRWIHARYIPHCAADGTILGAIALVTDITQRKRAESALRTAERMEAVGRLAGGVAHETNNQMTVVLGCAAFALRMHDLPAEVRQELLAIQGAAQRTAAITAQLLAFSRQQVLRAEPLDLNATVEAFAPILRRTLGERSELVLKLAPEIGSILADRAQVEQMLVNLTLNARDAMPGGGRLTLETRAATFTNPEPASDAREPLAPGRYAVLAVSDTGRGMTSGILERAFEPFFTTKPLGEGTGLGLSTVYGIVRQLGGDIHAESVPGGGTTFRIHLPLAGDPAPAEESAPQHGRSERKETGAVLVVEDEPQVRALAVRSLRAEGFEVLEAEHGRAALDLIGRRPSGVQLVVSDVAMPVMGGRELAEQLAGTYPGLPVLLMSGYAADELVRRGMLDADAVPLLQKPFSPDTLVRRVRALLAGTAPVPAGRGAA